MEDFLNWLLAAGIVIGIFFMIYMAYKQQGIIETINEIKGAFQDKAEEAGDKIAYQ